MTASFIVSILSFILSVVALYLSHESQKENRNHSENMTYYGSRLSLTSQKNLTHMLIFILMLV